MVQPLPAHIIGLSLSSKPAQTVHFSPNTSQIIIVYNYRTPIFQTSSKRTLLTTHVLKGMYCGTNTTSEHVLNYYCGTTPTSPYYRTLTVFQTSSKHALRTTHVRKYYFGSTPARPYYRTVISSKPVQNVHFSPNTSQNCGTTLVCPYYRSPILRTSSKGTLLTEHVPNYYCGTTPARPYNL